MIDAHHHLWSLARPECRWPTAADGVLHRDFALEDYRALAAARGVMRSIWCKARRMMPIPTGCSTLRGTNR
jgi:L-fuconolactonase